MSAILVKTHNCKQALHSSNHFFTTNICEEWANLLLAVYQTTNFCCHLQNNLLDKTMMLDFNHTYSVLLFFFLKTYFYVFVSACDTLVVCHQLRNVFSWCMQSMKNSWVVITLQSTLQAISHTYCLQYSADINKIKRHWI